MPEQKKVKYNKVTIDILDNGYMVTASGYNPVGPDPTVKLVRSSFDRVIGDLMKVLANNVQFKEENKKEGEVAPVQLFDESDIPF